MMSVVQECALVEQAIRRARSLTSPGACPPRSHAIPDVDGAAHSPSATTRMTDDTSGAVIAMHQRLAVENAAALSAAGQTDKALQAHLATAAATTHAGAQRLVAIANCTHMTKGAGADAMSPAAQRAILTALRSQLAQAAEVVDSVSRRGTDLAASIRSLRYGLPAAPAAREPQFPDGPVVWCVRPNGTFGKYRCSVLYPDLKVSTYWSPTDDTHG